ncbi:alpha/beta hydrolase fold protein [Penicillium subrubescens]|uniref:alpha/beta hydrolase fold protein n=1 Tax=Penicillium subrubescens TaxID=1316194 RepID=UPI0025458492|nr:alpha/beta hydrolase fold protein [Penicillium subrubescens]KAJ5875634.1 alpha/beta hydrolase fold protein [Penicillium subrubescens]
MIMGSRFCNLNGIVESVLELDIICVAIEYRLAPSHPDTAIIDDCYAGLQWTFKNAAKLGIDSSKTVITGLSTGAGLAAGVALASGYFSPMIDDYKDSGSAHARIRQSRNLGLQSEYG